MDVQRQREFLFECAQQEGSSYLARYMRNRFTTNVYLATTVEEFGAALWIAWYGGQVDIGDFFITTKDLQLFTGPMFFKDRRQFWLAFNHRDRGWNFWVPEERGLWRCQEMLMTDPAQVRLFREIRRALQEHRPRIEAMLKILGLH